MTRKMIKKPSSLTKISTWKSFNPDLPNYIPKVSKSKNRKTYPTYPNKNTNENENDEDNGSFSKMKGIIIPSTFQKAIWVWQKIKRDLGLTNIKKDINSVEWGYFVDIENLQGQHFLVSPLRQKLPKLNTINENGNNFVNSCDSDENVNYPLLVQLYDNGLLYSLVTVLSIRNNKSFVTKTIILAFGIMTLSIGGYNILNRCGNQGLQGQVG
jgi:hypothetical protein